MDDPSRARFGTPELVARTAVGGIAAGAVFLVANRWFATTVGDPATGPLLMMSTIVKGEDAMMSGAASAGLGLGVHIVLSLAFAAGFAAIAALLRDNAMIALAGVVYGAALYVVSSKILSPALFPVFKMANQPFELIAHMVFGTLVSVAFLRAEQPLRIGRVGAHAPT